MGKPLRVLIVEDSEDDVLLLLRELRRSGYELAYLRVDTAQAMESALVERAWDIVISDYSMPHFDGLTALSLLQRRGLDLPFIIVSGVIGAETAVKAMNAGAHDYVTKHNLPLLNAAVDRELRQLQVRRARRRAEHEERRLLRALQEQHRVLEQRVRELSALNKLFQEHIQQRFAVVQAYREAVGGLAKLLQQTLALAEHAKGQELPDISDVPGICEDMQGFEPTSGRVLKPSETTRNAPSE